jgi:hypothetical protein
MKTEFENHSQLKSDVEDSLGPIVVILIGIAYLINSFSLWK